MITEIKVFGKQVKIKKKEILINKKDKVKYTEEDLRYLGLIGSKAKVTRLHEVLREEGITIEHPDRLHAPVGLDIGAISPEEIAVSILAELIAVKYGKLEGAMDSGVKALRWIPPVKRTTPVAADS